MTRMYSPTASSSPLSHPALVLVVLALVLGVLPVRADEALDQYAVAAGHYSRQEWKLAAEAFGTFVDRYPDHAKAERSIFFLAETLLQQDRLEEAEKHFRRYLRRAPEGRFARAALFRAGEAAYLARQFARARTDLERFRQKYPDDKLNAYVLPYLGEIALSENRSAAAEKRFREGLKRFPDGRLQDDCRCGLARALGKQGRNEEAGRLYRAVAAKSASPLADDAQFRLGVLQYAERKYDEAIETFARFETTLTASTRQGRARLGHGLALMQLDRPDEARAVFEKIASHPKLGVEGRYWTGLAQKAEKDWTAAAQTLLTLVDEYPRHKLAAASCFQAGDALLRAGRTDEASEQFDRVIASAGPNSEWIDDAMRGKVQAALRKKDYKTLDRQAAEFAGRFPDSPLLSDVRRISARSLLELKQYGRALEALGPLPAGPTCAESNLEDRYLLSLAYEGLRRYDEALAALRPVLKSAEGGLKADAQLAEASLLMATGRFDEAVAPLQDILAAQPSGDLAVKGKARLAICLAKNNRFEEAKRYCGELLEHHGEHKILGPTVEQLAEDALAAGDPIWSAELFGWLADESGRDEYEAKGFCGLGWSQLKAGRLIEAAGTFGKLLEKEPEAKIAAEAALARGQILQQLEHLDPALAMYDRVVDRYANTPEHPKAMLAAARLRDRLQQHRQSAELYRRLVERYPKLPELDAALYEWSWVLQELGRTEESGALLMRLYQQHAKSPYWADAAYRLARRAMDAKNYDRAGELVDELLAAGPKPPIGDHALCLRWQIAAVDRQWDEVRRAAEQLINDYPQSTIRLLAEYWTAEAIYRQGDYQTAGRLLDDLARRTQGRNEPWLAMIPLRRAQVAAHRRKWTGAYTLASKIEADYPGFEQQYEVDYLVGRCLAARAEFEEARRAYRKVIRSPEGSKTETAAMAQWMIGETYFHQKDHEAALREYLRLEILYAYPKWQAGALLQAGKCRELLGQWQQAVRLYTRLLKSYPDTPFAEQAAHRLHSAREQVAVRTGS